MRSIKTRHSCKANKEDFVHGEKRQRPAHTLLTPHRRIIKLVRETLSVIVMCEKTVRQCKRTRTHGCTVLLLYCCSRRAPHGSRTSNSSVHFMQLGLSWRWAIT